MRVLWNYCGYHIMKLYELMEEDSSFQQKNHEFSMDFLF